MAEDEPNVDLDPGDFVYQSDQELFLVVMGETDEGYRFAVHGWRNISDERLEQYINGEHGKLHRQKEIERVVEEEADADTKRNFERLYDLFSSYTDGDGGDNGPHVDFALDDT